MPIQFFYVLDNVLSVRVHLILTQTYNTIITLMYFTKNKKQWRHKPKVTLVN
jgi:hypothetical protein